MKKGKLIGKIFGIALVFVMIGAMLGGFVHMVNAQQTVASNFQYPSTIRVLRTATGEIETVDFKEYVKNVLPNEWIASWDMDALKAGAMAVKTYAWYWTTHQKYPGEGYDVRDDTSDQVYKPGSSCTRTSQAVYETWNWIITKNNEVFQAQYDSGTPGSPEPLNPGRMSQWGTQYWAEKAKDWQWILHQYYDPVEVRLKVPLFDQNDEAWSGEQLGDCEDTYIGDKYGWEEAGGCVVTSMAMVLKYFEICVTVPSGHSITGQERIGMNPSILNDWLTWRDGYTDGCLMKWTILPNNVIPSERYYNPSTTGISEDTYKNIDNALQNGKPVIAGVHWADKPEDSHFIVITGRKGDTYVINDPWGGVATTLDAGAVGNYIIDHYRWFSSSSPNIAEKGLCWLRTRQNPNGSWQNRVGVTSMAALAFLNAGYTEDDPTVNKAIQYILANRNPDDSFGIYETYETSLAVLALVAADRVNEPDKYTTQIGKAKDWLVGTQYDETEGIDSDNPYWGGWSYGSNPSWADLSNTQFALMALDAASLPKSSTTWTRAITYVSRCQNKPAFEGHPGNDQDWAYDDTRPSYNDGGFIYCPEWSFVGETGSYGSITAGGIWSLRLCGVGVPDERVQAGLKWLANNEDCSFDDNPGMSDGRQFQYYYYMSIAKALTMCFIHDLGEVDWYAALSAELANLQYDDGHWVNSYTGHGWENMPELATDFALLALQTKQPPAANLWMSIILASNAELCVYDPQGRHACLGDVTIPGATFEIDGEGRQICNLKELEAGKYRFELTGTGDGDYSLTIKGHRDEEETSSETFEGTISEGEVQKSDALITSMVGALTIYVEEPEPLLVTDLPNVRLISADPTVDQINVSSLDLSEVDETYKPGEVISKYAYLVNAMGTGNFTLEFTDIVRANTIKVYKIDPTSTLPNQWVELDYTTTADTVTFTMAAGDPSVVFAGPANTPPIADAGPDQTVCAIPPATTAMVTLDGSGSYDPDADPLTYNWTWDGNTAYGVNPTVELPLGTTTITLVVNDGMVDSDRDTVDITVWIRATIDFDPDTLNLKSKGKFVTVYIELPPGYDVSQIDVSSITLNGTVPALDKPTKVGDYDSDGVPDLMVKFDGAAVQDLLTPGSQVEITITGEVTGIGFEGSDTIRVINN